MRYTAVHRSFMVSGAAVDASCAALGAWLRLESYVSSDGVESPLIVAARAWTDRKWLVTANVERADVDGAVAAGLAVWRGDDLEVLGFDAKGLSEVEARRRGGKKGGRGRKNSPPDSSAKGPPQLDLSSSKPPSSPLPSSPSSLREEKSARARSGGRGPAPAPRPAVTPTVEATDAWLRQRRAEEQRIASEPVALEDLVALRTGTAT
jgi:hypothetical protein